MPEHPAEPQIISVHGSGTACARVIVESTACADSLATIIRDQLILVTEPTTIAPHLTPDDAYP